MHIPDGLLAPQTYLPAFALAAPLWLHATRKLRGTLDETLLPRLAVFTALAFLLSSLMVPLPGGTSTHAVGVALMALVLGPWTAFLAYTLVLVVQALLVGAGGITALAANALLMGFVGAWTAVILHRWLHPLHGDAATGVAVWVSVVLSATLMATLLGVQPLIAQDETGSPLYFPFGLTVTLPAVVLPHMLLAIGEAVLTLLILRHARHRGWMEARAL
ncbi:energy-coupling factor ABC transporter permease [Alkalilimnicola ehrlichii MLHE-1]|uniref:Cobalamin (Vitamin B12) biosynthesis CbiM protein n=1 Tax=Alkalilimnicola ehrlichii (strain ATCC BAA-1101 / DSM 17681 / MLHE-1) TaxID=187272 RepID=Q0A712_ALKEH|nr:energy-coupling factor ABC transporter permease [Alkalilimnicola ehrlichii]ABI57375.1 cobalamin (vitamin B12) biosynthesis CbiM protein [Alkalilimnicola ehrlichii MLHE-1]